MLVNFVLSMTLMATATYEEFVSARAVMEQMESLYLVARSDAQAAAVQVNYWVELERECWEASVPYMMAGNIVAAQYHWVLAETYAAQKRMWEAELVLCRQEESDSFARWYKATERLRIIFEELKRQQVDPYR
jgi:hypothetical protein